MLEPATRALLSIVSQPLLTVAAAFTVFLAAVVGLYALHRWLETPVDRFCGLLARHDEVAVLMHPNPDPDAMASAMAVKALAESVETEVVFHHSGAVKHHENRAFATIFDLELRSVDDATELSSQTVVLVDHNEPRGFTGANSLSPMAVVDHHPGTGAGISFTDVRSDYGACATVFAEYIRTRFDDEPISAELATALIYGIQADTKSLTRGCTDAEFEASAYLYQFADASLLDRIATPEVPAEFLDVKSKAIANRRTDPPYVISDAGPVTNVDAIANAADELLQLEGIRAVVVYGTYEGTLHMSGRSRDDRVHMGRALRAAVDGIPMSEAGGHARMGGGQVSVPHMNGLGPGSDGSHGNFDQRLFSALRGDA